MAITFPINPLHGQQYAAPGIPITWQFDSGRNAWRVMRVGPAWMDIAGKPTEFPPTPHEHPIDDVTGLQGILDVKQDISARAQPNGYPSLDSDGRVPENQLPFGTFSGAWDDISGKPATFPPSSHTHPVAQISDSGTTGQQLVRAPTAADARNIIGAISPNDNARVTVKKNDGIIGVRRAFNLHEGTNITMSVVDDVASEEVDITINAAGGGGGSSLVVSETKPVAPTDNTMWLDVATGILFVYYNDGNTSQWIEALPYLQTMPGAFTKFDFPPAPINDQLYNPIPGATWKWSATRGVWFAVSTTSGSYTQAEADAKFVDIVGDVMTGPLGVVHPPTANTHAASKQYVDSKSVYTPSGGIAATTVAGAIAELDTEKVAKAGDTMTGLLLLSADPAAALGAATKQYVDAGNANALKYSAQSLTATQQQQARQNIYAAPFDALAYNGVQINGGMEVSQERGTTSTSGNGAYICDGFKQSFAGTMSIASLQAATSGSFPGFPNCLALLVATAQVSIGANDYVIIMQPIEGYRTARLAWGTANAQPITLGFWSSHHRAGVYGGSVRNGAVNRSYAFTYTHNVADTPQYNSITIPGDTAGTWAIDNTTGILLTFAVAAGSTYIAPSANTWVAGSYQTALGQVNGVGATSDAFRITGVTVIPGNEAPSAARSPFIMRPYDQELQTCKRYFYSGWPPLRGFISATNLASRMGAPHPVTMRASPTVTGVAAPGSLQVFTPGGAINVTAINTNFSTVSVIELELAVAGGSSGQPAIIFQGNAGIFLVDARL